MTSRWKNEFSWRSKKANNSPAKQLIDKHMQVKHRFALSLTIRTNQGVLQPCPTLLYKKIRKSKPHLTAALKSARLSFTSISIKNRVD